jgi:arsenite methyltransferase
MTDEMLDPGRRNAAEVGAENVEFLKVYLEDVPPPDATVDAPTGGPLCRSAVSDVVAHSDMDETTRRDADQ